VSQRMACGSISKRAMSPTTTRTEMTLYEIVTALQNEPSNLGKQAILDANKHNALLTAYMKAMMDPAINYYVTKVPKIEDAWQGMEEFNERDIYWMERLSSRELTGHVAKAALKGHVSALNAEGRTLVDYLIKRQIPKSKVGETMVLKTWPGLFFVPPYMRCMSMNAKIKAHFASKRRFYVQPKRDGSFAYGVKPLEGPAKLITRTGNHYPTWLAERILRGLPRGSVLIGEMEVYQRGAEFATPSDGHNWKLLDRKTGNGLLNSVSDDNESEFTEHSFEYVAWDMLTLEEFEAGTSDRDYSNRLLELDAVLLAHEPDYVQMIETHEVESVEAAYAIHTDLTTRGLEGTVWKTMDGKWKDTSSGTKDCVKLKVVFEADYRVDGFYEGEGKYEGMLGGITVSTECKKLRSNCGSGFNDEQRQTLWKAFNESFEPGALVAAVEANDVISKRGEDLLSLSLPIFVEFRTRDKKTADTLERVIEQRDAAREGK
jgi:hypothetical protein